MQKVFLSLLLILTTAVASAVTFDLDGIRYNILSQQDNTVEVAIIPKSISYPSYSTYSGDFNIPSSVTFNGKTYTVIGIGSSAFSECSKLGSIVLPNTLKYIGFGAFAYSNLTELTIPEGVDSIGAAAFRDCHNISELILPKSLKVLESTVFYNCYNLEKVIIKSNELTEIQDDTFFKCSSLKEFSIPETVISLGKAAFYYTPNLSSLKIPVGVTKIGSQCFAASGIVSLDIPDAVTELPGAMFSGCSNLKSIKLPSNLTSLSKSMFSGCTALESITIPDGITSIPSSCFYNCYSLAEIDFPPYLSFIGDDSFIRCKALKSVHIPEGVTIIYSQAFFDCAITDLTLPSTLKEVGGWSFGLGEMKELTLPAELAKIGSYAFDDVVLEKVVCLNPTPAICEENAFKNETYYGTLSVPSQSLELYKSTTPWKNFFNIVGHEMSSVEGINTDNEHIIVGYYNIYGVSSSQPFDGLNIVKYSDGSSKKIVY